MAERNPVMPVNNPEPNVVSWPGSAAESARANTPGTTSELAHAAGEKVQAASEKVKAASEKVKEAWQTGVTAAQDSLHRTRRELSSRGNSFLYAIRRFADERPLHFVGIVASAAFVAGVVLRVWRSSRYES